MAKIGTAHIEIKPVLDAEALEALATAIERAVAAGVERGMKVRSTVNIHGPISVDADRFVKSDDTPRPLSDPHIY